MSRTVDDALSRLPGPAMPRLPAPAYRGDGGPCVGLAVPSMRLHMTDEGWTLFTGLQSAGYRLHGFGLGLTDAAAILRTDAPGTVVVQDQREWEGRTAGRGFDDRERFVNVSALRDRPDVFTVTVLKDAHSNPAYHRDSAAAMGAHAWVVYYAPRIVAHLAPFVRPEHLIRTHHTVDVAQVPAYSPAGRAGALLSGALSAAYPLRQRLVANRRHLPECTWLAHPGYRRDGCKTPDFLRLLSRFKVAICTSSVYGYALRKIVEATACGCVVVTDLPSDDVLPGGIDGNLVRIAPDMDLDSLAQLLWHLYADYDAERQEDMAARACAFYDFRAAGARLAADVETLRRAYL